MVASQGSKKFKYEIMSEDWGVTKPGSGSTKLFKQAQNTHARAAALDAHANNAANTTTHRSTTTIPVPCTSVHTTTQPESVHVPIEEKMCPSNKLLVTKDGLLSAITLPVESIVNEDNYSEVSHPTVPSTIPLIQDTLSTRENNILGGRDGILSIIKRNILEGHVQAGAATDCYVMLCYVY